MALRTFDISEKALEALKRIQQALKKEIGANFTQSQAIERMLLENDPDKKKEAK